MSKEVLDTAGFVVEYIRYSGAGGTAEEADHWWFERGMPVRHVSRGAGFFKRGEQWISQATGKSWAPEPRP